MAITLGGAKVLVCAGTGGVGKTTVSAALGLKLAAQGERVLVLTIDPARRLAGALGLKDRLSQAVRVPVPGGRGELYAEMVVPQVVFEDFVRRCSPDSTTAERLIKNRLFYELSTSLSGSQEFTAQERLLVAVESGKYDRVILDTPPSQHAIDFLRAPERIFALFQESVTRWFATEAKSGLLQNLIYKGTQKAFGALERITGSEFLHELSEFFVSISSIQKTVAQRSIAVHRLLASEDTAFILVTAFDDAKIKEAMEFSQDMRRSGYHLRGMVINRSFPDWLSAAKDERILGSGDEFVQRLMDFYGRLAEYFREREALQEAALTKFHENVAVIRLPDLKDEIVGVDGLNQVAGLLKIE